MNPEHDTSFFFHEHVCVPVRRSKSIHIEMMFISNMDFLLFFFFSFSLCCFTIKLTKVCGF